MAKNQKQRLYDDLNDLVDKYPRMYASDFIATLDGFQNGLWHSLPVIKGRPKKNQRVVERRSSYRLA